MVKDRFPECTSYYRNESTPKPSRSLKLSWFGELLQLFHPKLAYLIAPLRILCNKGALHGRAHCKKHFEAIKEKSQAHKCWEILTSHSQVSSNQMHPRMDKAHSCCKMARQFIVYALRSLTVQWYSNIQKSREGRIVNNYSWTTQPTERRSVQRIAYCLN